MKKHFLAEAVLIGVCLTSVSGFAFSDMLEPLYPQITAQDRTVDEIYSRTSSASLSLSQDIVDKRKEIIQMYKAAGIDISFDMENYSSTKIKSYFPRRYSKQTPSDIENGDYRQVFSVDAPWNNKVDYSMPRVVLNDDAFPRDTIIPGLVNSIEKAKGRNSTGSGIPYIIENEEDPVQTIAYAVNNKVEGHANRSVLSFHIPKNIAEKLNAVSQGDRHLEYVSPSKGVVASTWLTVPSGGPMGYSVDDQNSLVPGYDMRSSTGSVGASITGILENVLKPSSNAVGMPFYATSVKEWEINDPDAKIEHALGMVIPKQWSARVYPADSTDNFMKMNGEYGSDNARNTGSIPYGALVYLDNELDVDGLYENNKISLPAYKILKAMQEYGVYNTDAGNSGWIYTATGVDDWLKTGDARYNVPSQGNRQGWPYVMNELRAFFQNDAYFAFDGVPKMYITIPNARYTSLDINGDGTVTQADCDIVSSNIGKDAADPITNCDVTKDGKIDHQDVEIFYRYLNDEPMHSDNYFFVTYKDLDRTQGYIQASGAFKVDNGVTLSDDNLVKKIKQGTTVCFSACPEAGYEFVKWTGDFEGETEQCVWVKDVQKPLVIGAKFRKIEEMCSLDIEKEGNGTIKATMYERWVKTGEPKPEYFKGALVELEAVPDEGYVFAKWDGDASGVSSKFPLMLDSDKKVTAQFVPISATGEPAFDKNAWICPDKSAIAEVDYTVSEADKNVKFMTWSKKYILVNQKMNLPENYTLFIDLTPGNTTNKGEIIFNYENINNYYYLRFDSTGTMEFRKKYHGIDSPIKIYDGDGKFVKDGVSYSKLASSYEISRIDNEFSICGYDSYGNRCDYFSGIKDDCIQGRNIGVGSVNNGSFLYKNMKYIDRGANQK